MRLWQASMLQAEPPQPVRRKGRFGPDEHVARGRQRSERSSRAEGATTEAEAQEAFPLLSCRAAAPSTRTTPRSFPSGPLVRPEALALVAPADITTPCPTMHRVEQQHRQAKPVLLKMFWR